MAQPRKHLLPMLLTYSLAFLIGDVLRDRAVSYSQ